MPYPAPTSDAVSAIAGGNCARISLQFRRLPKEKMIGGAKGIGSRHRVPHHGHPSSETLPDESKQ